MTYKELTPQEVTKMLSENPNGFEGYVRDTQDELWLSKWITRLSYPNEYCFFANNTPWRYCAIAIPDTYEPYPEDEMPNLEMFDVVVEKDTGIEQSISTIDRSKKSKLHIYLSRYGWVSNIALFEQYTNLDGSPIGRKVGEE